MLTMLAPLLALGFQKQVAPQVTFEKDLLPMLKRECVACHNSRMLGLKQVSGGLSLESYASTLAGVKLPNREEKVLVQKKPETSSLYARLVTADAGKRMPKGGESLSVADVQKVKEWILAGAPRGVPNAAGAVTPKEKPVIRPATDVFIPTTVALPDPLKPKEAGKDPRFQIRATIGPLSAITSVSFSPDGKLLAAGTYQGVALIDIGAGKLTRTLTPMPGSAQGLAWSTDGSQLGVACGEPGQSGEVLVFDAKADFKQVARITGHTDVVYSVAFSPDGKRLATASHDKTVRTWDLPSGKPHLTLKAHSDVVYRVAFLPDGKLLSVSSDKSVRAYEMTKGEVARSFEGHTKEVTCLAVRPDGAWIVTSGGEPRLRVWNPADGGTVRYFDGLGGQVNDVVFSKDGKFIAACNSDRYVKIWDMSGNQAGLTPQSPDWPYCLALTADAKYVVSGGADGVVRVYDRGGAPRFSLAMKIGEAGTQWLAVSNLGYWSADPVWEKRVAYSFGTEKLAANPAFGLLKDNDLAWKALKDEPVNPPKIVPPAAPMPTPAPKPVGAPAAKP